MGAVLGASLPSGSGWGQGARLTAHAQETLVQISHTLRYVTAGRDKIRRRITKIPSTFAINGHWTSTSPMSTRAGTKRTCARDESL